MDIEVIQNEDHLLSVHIWPIEQPFHEVCPIEASPPLTDLAEALTRKRFDR
jgi:hypothetical protein